MQKRILETFFKVKFEKNDLHLLRDLFQTILILGVLISLITFLMIKGKYFEIEFWEGVLVEAHGMILDIFVVGFILYIVQIETGREKEKAQLIEAFQNRIDDLKNWHSTESKQKIFHHLKRLIKLKAKQINLSNCNLEGIDFSKLDLNKVNFTNCRLDSCNFRDSLLTDSILSGATMNQVIINESDIELIRSKGAIIAKENEI